MVIEHRRHVVYVSGSLCSNQWPVIRTTAFLILEQYPTGIVINFTEAQWASAAGESTLVAAMNEIERHNLPFVLLNFSSSSDPVLSASVSRRLAEGAETWWNRLSGAA